MVFDIRHIIVIGLNGLLALLLLLTINACTTVRTEAIIPNELDISKKNEYSIQVSHEGQFIREPSSVGPHAAHFGRSDATLINDEAFMKAISTSLVQSNLFRVVETDSEADFRLDVNIVKEIPPEPGLQMRSYLETRWKLTRNSDKNVLFTQVVRKEGTATPGSFVGVRTAKEAAVRLTIQEGIRELSQIKDEIAFDSPDGDEKAFLSESTKAPPPMRSEKEPEFTIYGVEDLPGLNFTNSLGMEFVYIEPGSFMMGSPLDEPEREDNEKQHQVTLTKGYYIQTTEVTQGQWKAVMGDNPSSFSRCGDNCPVEDVSWKDVQEFIRKLYSQEGNRIYRLPTEAEWEYACRAGSKTPFSFGKCLSADQANYDGRYPMPKCSKGRYREKTIPVASFEPNAWGLYDMHGNVWEWCQDWHNAYPSGSVTNPVGPTSGSRRILRGGCWCNYASYCRSAYRYWSRPGSRSERSGFRLVLPSGQ